MLIKIVTLSGNTYNYNVEINDSILSLKDKFIISIKDYTINNQYFYYKNEYIKDESKTFNDYNITNDAVLFIGFPNINYKLNTNI